MQNFKIGFIGPGKMAKAIVNGIISTSFLPACNLYIYGRSLEKVAYFAELGCISCLDLGEISQSCDIIFLCIKPQNFPEILAALKPVVSNKILYVSIAAGVTAASIRQMLGCPVKVVRAMPNTPLLLGRGATAICGTENVDEASLSTICNVFSSCGMVRIIEESQMDAIINVSGSSPAYLYLFAKHVRVFAEERGILPTVATAMFAQTLIGAGHMLLDTGLSEDELISMVASKGGTTQAALDVLHAEGFREVLRRAMDACERRAEELGKA